MRISKLMKFLLAAALPLFAIDDETASATDAKQEVDGAGNAASADTGETNSDAAAGDEAPTIADVLDPSAGDVGNVGASDADAASANDTQSSAANASSAAGTEADPSQDSAHDDDWLTTHQGEYDAGLKCSLHGLAVADMSREQLIAFVGFLDTVSVGLGTRFAEA